MNEDEVYEMGNRAVAAVLTVLYLALASAFLLPELLTLKGLLLAPVLLMAITALARIVPTPNDMRGFNSVKAWFRAIAITFVTWLVFLTITHLSEISGPRYWADLVLLRSNIPRGGRSLFSAITAITAGMLSFPPLVRSITPAAEYFEDFIPTERLLGTMDEAREAAASAMDRIRSKK